jgi:hypothetical protein
LAKTPVVGKVESTMPMASKPILGPKSDLKQRDETSVCTEHDIYL